MLIFLDFDGVLHAHGDQPFARADLFEAFVLARPGVEVVISSSWRETLSFPVLLDLFSDAFRGRILGVTPVLPERHREFVDAARTVFSERGIRQREIEAYVAAHHPGRPWVALDDVPGLFSGTERLIHVERGLDETVLATLDRHVQASLAAAAIPATTA
jgi:hypothetical protein